MKKLWILTLWIILIVWTLSWCGENKNVDYHNSWDLTIENDSSDFIIEDISSETEAAIRYNDNLVDIASKCITSEDGIRNSYLNGESIDNIKTAINETIKTCSETKNDIISLWDWEWDSSLKDWVIDIIDKYITYYSKFNKLLPYIEQKDITEEENESYETLVTEIEALDDELNEANNNLIYTQAQFASNHWFELESDE